MRKKGFTLIELLVVIAIIAILLSILLPSLNKVKQVARDVVCRSNIKQWSLIFAMYTQENDGKFPGQIDGLNFDRGEWIVPLRDYMETDSDISLCPTAKKDDVSNMYGSTFTAHEISDPSASYFKEKCSYGVNCWTFAEPLRFAKNTDWENIHWKKATAARNSSNVPVFMDSKYRGAVPHYNGTNGNPDTIAPTATQDAQINWASGMGTFAMPRHGGGSNAGINVMFLDLSVRHVYIKELWRLEWYKGMNISGYTNNGGTWPQWMQKYKDR